MVWEIEMGEEERRGEENCYRIVNYIVNQGVILFTGGKKLLWCGSNSTPCPSHSILVDEEGSKFSHGTLECLLERVQEPLLS